MKLYKRPMSPDTQLKLMHFFFFLLPVLHIDASLAINPCTNQVEVIQTSGYETCYLERTNGYQTEPYNNTSADLKITAEVINTI